MHYGTLTGMDFTTQPYVVAPSTKLDGVLGIVTHHLPLRGAPPLRTRTDEEKEADDAVTRAQGLQPPEDSVNKLVVDTAVVPAAGSIVKANGHDKIVIFIAFPKNIAAVECALESRGVAYLSYHGKVDPTHRAKKLREFQESDVCNVMIVSHVALAGLNLWFARILIIVVGLCVLPSPSFTESFIGSALVGAV